MRLLGGSLYRLPDETDGREKIKRLLLMSTGALLSTISPMQGESIPGIAHAVSLEVD